MWDSPEKSCCNGSESQVYSRPLCYVSFPAARRWPRIVTIPFVDVFFDFASILFAKQCRDTSIKYIETFVYVWMKYEFSPPPPFPLPSPPPPKKRKMSFIGNSIKSHKKLFNADHWIIQTAHLELSRAEIVNLRVPLEGVGEELFAFLIILFPA